MTRHLQREITRLKDRILELSAIVESVVEKAVLAVEQVDLALADAIVADDDRIDTKEVELEEDCLKVLALHQPVAIDLRFIIAVLKINNDLERIGDLAANIARRAHDLCDLPRIPVLYNFLPMAAGVKAMLHKSLDALVTLDVNAAQEVCRADVEIDRMHREMFKLVQQEIEKEPAHTQQCVTLLSVSRHLERIADHATNIAEDIIYMIEGSIVRHGRV